jgi:uncharacterized protein (DUF305 family)
MKKALFIAGITAVLTACNSEEQQSGTSTNTDTASHSGVHGAHTASSGTTNSTGDTIAIAGQSMMSLMQRNMDQMKAMPSTGNPDNDFAAMMKTHHMGALEMAQLEVAKGQNPQLKQMAQKMIDEQQQEIAQLNSFLSGHQAHGGGDAFYKDVMRQMNNMKMDMDHSGSMDKQFAQMMIPHHQGAIDMARSYLKSGAHEEQLKTMANKIIQDQQQEINDLQAWLTKNKQPDQ